MIRNGPVFHPPASLHLHLARTFYEREPHRRASAGTPGASVATHIPLSVRFSLHASRASCLRRHVCAAECQLRRAVSRMTPADYARCR